MECLGGRGPAASGQMTRAAGYSTTLGPAPASPPPLAPAPGTPPPAPQAPAGAPAYMPPGSAAGPAPQAPAGAPAYMPPGSAAGPAPQAPAGAPAYMPPGSATVAGSLRYRSLLRPGSHPRSRPSLLADVQSSQRRHFSRTGFWWAERGGIPGHRTSQHDACRLFASR